MMHCHAYPVWPVARIAFRCITVRSATRLGYLSAFRRYTGIVFQLRLSLACIRDSLRRDNDFSAHTKRMCAKISPTTTTKSSPTPRDFPATERNVRLLVYTPSVFVISHIRRLSKPVLMSLQNTKTKQATFRSTLATKIVDSNTTKNHCLR